MTGEHRTEGSCEITSHFIWLNRLISIKCADFYGVVRGKAIREPSVG